MTSQSAEGGNYRFTFPALGGGQKRLAVPPTGGTLAKG